MPEINEILSVVADPRMGLAALAAFLSFVVQGYSGFGGGIIVVPILAFIFGPVEAVAINVIPSFLANISLVPSLAKDTNARELRPLRVGVLLTIPIGLFFLVSVEPEIIRKGMGVFIILIALVLISGWRYTGKRGLGWSRSRCSWWCDYRRLWYPIRSNNGRLYHVIQRCTECPAG